MKDIEQLFKEKLQHQQVTPPADTWEKLEGAWQQKEHKKKGGWLWLAASIALLLASGGVFYLNYYRPQANTSIAIDLPDTSRTGEAIALQAPKVPDETLEEQENVIAETSLDVAREEQTTVADKKVSEEPDPELAQQSLTPEQIHLPEPLAQIEAVQPEVIPHSVPTHINLPDQTLLAEASTNSKPKVTIIYKSGRTNSPVEEEETKNPLEKAVSFLNNIKENGVGFSELRSAKTELLTKAFSNKREPMSAE